MAQVGGAQTPTAACASGGAAPMHWGLGVIGHQQAAPGIYLCYLLLLSGSILRVEYHSYWWYIGLMTNEDLEDLCYENI